MYAYYYEAWNLNIPVPDPDHQDSVTLRHRARTHGKDFLDGRADIHPDLDDGWVTAASPLFKRNPDNQMTKWWETSQISLPAKMNWRSAISQSYNTVGANFFKPYQFFWDDSAGEGQYVYLTNEAWIWLEHDVSLTLYICRCSKWFHGLQ
jgi:hypothetical protein